MKCKNCGKRFSKGDFCPSCGYNMKADADKTCSKKKRKGYILLALIVIFLLAIIVGVLCLFLSGKIPGIVKAPERLNYETELAEVSEKLNEESAWEALQAVSTDLGIADLESEYEYQGGSERDYFTVYRFNQYYDGIEVINQGLKVVVDKDGEILFTSGNYAEIDEKDIIFSGDSDAAADIAVEYLANTYDCDVDAVAIGGVSKVIFAADEQTDVTTAAYEVCVGIAGETVTSVYVDGGSGEVIGDYSEWSYDTYMTSQELEGQTGTQTVELTYDTEDGKYYFWDINRNVGVFDFAKIDKVTKDLDLLVSKNISNQFWLFSPFGDITDSINEGNEKNAADALSNVQTTYDYYLETFGRKGIDGQNRELCVWINYELNGMKAAYWREGTYDFIAVENVKGVTATNDLNSIAHEYTHGVIEAEDGIILPLGIDLQKTEVQGISEGLADLFAEFAEAWVNKKTDENRQCDWINTYVDRNIANSSGSNISSVDEYKSGVTDCHDSSTVVSHPAYLMTEGIGNNEKIELGTLEDLYYNTILTMKCSTFEEFRKYLEMSAVVMNDRKSKYGEAESRLVLTDGQLETVIDAMDTSGIEPRLADYKATPAAELCVYDRLNKPYSDYTYTIRKGHNGEILVEEENANSSSFILPDSIVPGYYWVTLTDQQDTTKTETFCLLVNDNSDENKTSAYQDSVDIYTDFGFLYLDVTVTSEKETVLSFIPLVTASGNGEAYTAELTTDLNLVPVYRLTMPEGQYVIHVLASGYVSQEIEITLKEDDELEVILKKTNVFGTVTDSETGESLEGVKISVESASWESDGDGFFSHHMDNAGAYIISFELEGYDSVSVEAAVSDASDTDLGTVEMTPSALGETVNDMLIFNGHTYKLFDVPEVNSWSDAKSYCEALGGHLATITSQDEQKAVYDYIVSLGCGSAYFGLTDSETEGTWVWITDEPVNFTNWHKSEPNSENKNEDYAMFYYKYKDGTWNDGDFGGRTVNGGTAFICEWEYAD